MARWRLTEACYFNTIPPLEWEYKEINDQTGQLHRVVLPVPSYLNPQTIVCHENKGRESDIVFLGEPVPSMMPLDSEAEEITAKLRPKWDHPIESLPAQGTSLLPETRLMMEEFAKTVGEAVRPIQVITRDEFDALREQLAAVMKKNAELEKAATRRV